MTQLTQGSDMELREQVQDLVSDLHAECSVNCPHTVGEDDKWLTEYIMQLFQAHEQRHIDRVRDIIKIADEYTFKDGTTVYSKKRLDRAVTEARIDESRYWQGILGKPYDKWVESFEYSVFDDRIAELEQQLSPTTKDEG